MKYRFGLSKRQEITIEVLNAVTHGIPCILSGLALFYLIHKGLAASHKWALTAYMVYGISLICLFLNSTLYHSFSFSKLRPLLQKFDHASIYLLIAGTFTPYLTLALSDPYNWIATLIIWSLAVIGIVFEVGWTNRFPKLSTALYLLMGWLGALLIYPLWQTIPRPGLYLLALGGLIYSLGTYFYAMKHNKWMHIIWHLFVNLAALMMFLSIYYYV
ncbi:hemolysin III family protein [Ignavigranum ruoffiae]|uniref:PAQR family membrane homeostasis protein TrhA n=1 Tax=Ignavigranum ruoffiae TaxID=89093 RepID=UPI002354380E|nr:hemolysin III family protein [Ignavigranum ruoffiae]